MKWIRYRFRTKSIEDCRPLVFNPSYPWWCSGFNDTTAVLVAWLPKSEDLRKYWDDAEDITEEEYEEIKFSGRFPQPAYYIPLSK